MKFHASCLFLYILAIIFLVAKNLTCFRLFLFFIYITTCFSFYVIDSLHLNTDRNFKHCHLFPEILMFSLWSFFLTFCSLSYVLVGFFQRSWLLTVNTFDFDFRIFLASDLTFVIPTVQDKVA